MLKLKQKLCETVRQHIIEIDGRPTFAVCKKTLQNFNGSMPDYLDSHDGTVYLRIGENAVRNYKAVGNDIIFSATFNGIEETLLIPTVSIIAIFDADNQEMSLGFNIKQDVARYKAELEKLAPDITSIINKVRNEH